MYMCFSICAPGWIAVGLKSTRCLFSRDKYVCGIYTCSEARNIHMCHMCSECEFVEVKLSDGCKPPENAILFRHKQLNLITRGWLVNFWRGRFVWGILCSVIYIYTYRMVWQTCSKFKSSFVYILLDIILFGKADNLNPTLKIDSKNKPLYLRMTQLWRFNLKEWTKSHF